MTSISKIFKQNQWFLNRKIIFSFFLLFSLFSFPFAEANNRSQIEEDRPSMFERVSRWILRKTDITGQADDWLTDPHKKTHFDENEGNIIRSASHWIGDIRRKKLQKQTESLIQRIVDRDWKNEAEKKELSSLFQIALGKGHLDRDDDKWIDSLNDSIDPLYGTGGDDEYERIFISSNVLVKLDPASQEKVLQFITEVKDPMLDLLIARILHWTESPEIKLLISRFLGEIKPKFYGIQRFLLQDGIRFGNEEVKEAAFQALMAIQPTDRLFFSELIEDIALYVSLSYKQPSLGKWLELLANTLPESVLLSEKEADTLSKVLHASDHNSRSHAAHILGMNGPFKTDLYFNLYDMGHKEEPHSEFRLIANQATKSWMERAAEAAELKPDVRLVLQEIQKEKLRREKVARNTYEPALTDADPSKRSKGIQYFLSNPTGHIALPSEVLTKLSTIATSDPVISLRIAAIKALGKILAYDVIGDRALDFTRQLIQIAEETEELDKIDVIEVLGNTPFQNPHAAAAIHAKLIFFLSDADIEIKRAALLSLSKLLKPINLNEISREVVFSIAELLKDPEMEATAIYVLRQIEPELFRITQDPEDLYSIMNETEKSLSRETEDILGREESQISLPFLAVSGSLPPDDTENYERIVAALTHPSPLVKFFARKALEKIETNNPDHPLIAHALIHRNALVRETTIGHLNDQEIVDRKELRQIAKALSSKDPLVQHKAKDLLKSIEDRSSVQKQFEEDIAKSEDPEIRANAELALSVLHSLSSEDKSSVDSIQGPGYEDESKLEELFTQLETLLQTEAVDQEPLDKLKTVEDLLIFSTDKSKLSILVEASILHPSKEIRDKAFKLIGKLHDRETQAIAYLKEARKDDHPNSYIRKEASLALQRVRAVASTGICRKWIQESIDNGKTQEKVDVPSAQQVSGNARYD